MTKNGTNYSISFDMSNIVISKAKFNGISEMKPLRTPQDSRVVDFSRSVGGIPESTGSVSYGANLNGSLNGVGVEYDSSLGHWVTKNSPTPSTGHHLYNQGIHGDCFMVLEDVGPSPALLFWYENGNSSSSQANSLSAPGLTRKFMPLGVHNPTDYAQFDQWNADAKSKLIYGGFTYPINTVLYCGASGSTLHSYQWQSASNGSLITYDATTASKLVTTSACAKLKSDYGSNIKIYVIKYRKQLQYKQKITGAATNFDYDYLNDCASGTSAPYLQDVTTEAALKSALQTIATDIKSFGGYSSAKNVE
jgi:hypothetical protein